MFKFCLMSWYKVLKRSIGQFNPPPFKEEIPLNFSSTKKIPQNLIKLSQFNICISILRCNKTLLFRQVLSSEQPKFMALCPAPLFCCNDESTVCDLLPMKTIPNVYAKAILERISAGSRTNLSILCLMLSRFYLRNAQKYVRKKMTVFGGRRLLPHHTICPPLTSTGLFCSLCSRRCDGD